MNDRIKEAVDCIEYLLESDISNPRNPSGFDLTYLKLALANAKKASTALEAFRSIIAGTHVIVPVEPTQEAVQIGYDTMRTNNVINSSEQGRVKRIYRAMIAAAQGR